MWGSLRLAPIIRITDVLMQILFACMSHLFELQSGDGVLIMMSRRPVGRARSVNFIT